MIKTTIIDNWLELDLANYLSVYLEKGIWYKNGHSSSNESNTSFLYGEVPYSPLIEYLVIKLKAITPIELLRVYANLHFLNMGGAFHPDDGDITFLYMPSKGLNPDEGHFEIRDEGKYEYKFNRLIYFDAKKLHKGNAPIQNLSRITLAFKTKSLLVTK
jgi:hypothetical protein